MNPVSAAQSLSDNEPVSVGKYKLIANLGRGGMADVFLAVVAGPLGVNKLQVVKRLRAEFAEDPERREMFLDEARIATRLNHPNVVQTFEVHAEKGVYFITMEYLEGAPMNRLINRSSRTKTPAPPGVLLRILADVLAGLHYAHELADYDGKPLNIVHRDVSPHNVIVSYDGQAKLLDFGIAKSDVRMMETRTGIMKGKLGYMAPEQVRCKPLDRRADVFVAGIVLWEILAGRKMWDKAADMEVLHKLATGDLPSIESVRPDVPPALAKICGKALSYDPADRYTTAAEMRAAILDYLDSAKIRVTPEDIGKYVTSVYADKRAEIRKIIERQIAKLRQSEASSPSAEDMPASSMRVMRADTAHGGSEPGVGANLPNLRSMPPSMEAPDTIAPEIPPPPSLPAPASLEPPPVTPTLDRNAGPKTEPPAVRTKQLTPVVVEQPAELVEAGPESSRGSERVRWLVALVVVFAAAVGAFVVLRMRQTHAPPAPPAAVGTSPHDAKQPSSGPVTPAATTTTPRK
ncbi:serine/threonine-protein kinase [Polyangium sp. 15x6]|uniref:serine/threonine protein kinase n=1 Tax=Polyangium sp. 15x6 TaxID=3042687 RepID=UPI00249B5B7D|nr:serine/threonine-protein kinase [Polyangium sp. 15x6]MDI3290979.1 serine/threonine-protein kinase [Polyangium sp. 15x6]